jgi:hypothetical protein
MRFSDWRLGTCLSLKDPLTLSDAAAPLAAIPFTATRTTYLHRQRPAPQTSSRQPHRASAARAARPALLCPDAHADKGLSDRLAHHLRLLERQGG